MATSKISSALVTLFAVGTLFKISNLLKIIGIDASSANSAVYFLSFGLLTVTTLSLIYISSALQFLAFIIYSICAPRNIDITQSRFDFVNRSMLSINKNNVLRWIIEIKREKDSLEIFYSKSTSLSIERYYQHFSSLGALDDEIFDKSCLDNIMVILQEKYEYLNERFYTLRIICTALLLLSLGIGLVTALGAIVDNLIFIYES